MRFCLVTTHHLCNNPRLVKEADTLAAAGHEVRVVWLNARADLFARDKALVARRPWQTAPVTVERRGGTGWLGWAIDGTRREAARRLDDAGVGGRWLSEQAIVRYPRRLERGVRAAPADVVVAHTLGALPPAARAARAIGAKLVFDAEDLHVGELPTSATNARARIARVERRYLPRCDRVLASSDGIADALVRMYSIPRPRVILNSFPLPARSAADPARSGAPIRLYWYSQVIGTDRGIQTALDAMALVGGDVELHLRGEYRPELTQQLMARATSLGLADRIHLHPLAPPDDLPALSAENDIGLALEIGYPENRALCVTNKLLTYLAAGLAVAVSDTPGQRAVLARAPAAGFLFPPGDARALAAGLRALIDEPGRLRDAKRASRGAAEEWYSWERERPRLLHALADWTAGATGSAVWSAV